MKKATTVVPYVPGDLTDEKHRDPRYSVLSKYRLKQDQIHQDAAPLNGYPGTREDFTRPIPNNEMNTKEAAEMFYGKHREMLTEKFDSGSCCIKKGKKVASPIIAAIRNFDLAKKLHKENLEHKPLPDTVTDAMYRKLQMQGTREPGLALKEGNYASGVAWKAYPAYGPTRCTKLKVFRPKTSITHKIKDSANDRPSSVNSFDKKWRFIRQRKVTPIQLAVCWDLTPMNPNDEPKRTPHIDGSNGSLAPAVFSLVHSPKNEVIGSEKSSICEEEKLPYMYDPQAYIAQTTARNIKDNGGNSQNRRTQSAYNLHHQNLAPVDDIRDTQSVHSLETHINYNGSKYCSRECSKARNKQINSRLCVACEMKKINIKGNNIRPKSEYKMAFKAGVPQKVSNTDCSNCSLTVPKMKDPYQVRKYAIHSLAPPFSLQNFKRQDYPEHWRLATVYQHSYKPIQARKRPLLQTVFK